MSRYLVGRAASPTLIARYREAVSALGVPALTPLEEQLWKLASVSRFFLGLADSGLAIHFPGSPLRRRLLVMAAVCEASPDHCDAFLPRPYPPIAWAGILAAGLRLCVCAALGALLVGALRLRYSHGP